MIGSKNGGTFIQRNTMQQKERRNSYPLWHYGWKELEGTMLNEISQVVKDIYHMILPIGGT